MRRAIGGLLMIVCLVALYDLYFGGVPSSNPLMAGWLILLVGVPGVLLWRKRKPKTP